MYCVTERNLEKYVFRAADWYKFQLSMHKKITKVHSWLCITMCNFYASMYTCSRKSHKDVILRKNMNKWIEFNWAACCCCSSCWLSEMPLFCRYKLVRYFFVRKLFILRNYSVFIAEIRNNTNWVRNISLGFEVLAQN